MSWRGVDSLERGKTYADFCCDDFSDRYPALIPPRRARRFPAKPGTPVSGRRAPSVCPALTCSLSARGSGGMRPAATAAVVWGLTPWASSPRKIASNKNDDKTGDPGKIDWEPPQPSPTRRSRGLPQTSPLAALPSPILRRLARSRGTAWGAPQAPWARCGRRRGALEDPGICRASTVFWDSENSALIKPSLIWSITSSRHCHWHIKRLRASLTRKRQVGA